MNYHNPVIANRTSASSGLKPSLAHHNSSVNHIVFHKGERSPLKNTLKAILKKPNGWCRRRRPSRRENPVKKEVHPPLPLHYSSGRKKIVLFEK